MVWDGVTAWKPDGSRPIVEVVVATRTLQRIDEEIAL
jgi:hypothetical protein